jgi:uncharacterized protein (DUF1786 family)
LAIDIGGGTQDMVLYDSETVLENAVKLVLPSPTIIAARRIAKITAAGRPLFLSGRVMGGGAVSRAIRNHLEAGLAVQALPGPALTLKDNLDQVRSRGVRIADRPPEAAADADEVVLGDLDLEALADALARFEVALPSRLALAIQDHGFSPHASNRLTRFAQWQRFLDAGGRTADLLFDHPPANLSRWRAAAETAPEAVFMDTAAAALRGAMLDPVVADWLPEGALIVNAGNEHTVMFLIQDKRVFGVYEQHTGRLDENLLADHVDRFADGALTNQEIFDAGGHGLAYHPDYQQKPRFDRVAVTGPNRALAEKIGHLAAPHGEMMLSGCFGLIEAVRERESR